VRRLGSIRSGSRTESRLCTVLNFKEQTFDGTQLQGASLNDAGLQGANLDDAELQGADLGGAQLQAASFSNAFVWRVNTRRVFWEKTRVSGSEAGPKHQCAVQENFTACDWTERSFEKLKKLIAESLPEGNLRHNAIRTIEERLDPTKSLEGEEEMAKSWIDQQHVSLAPDIYDTSLADQWRETGCAAEGAPYVIEGLLSLHSGSMILSFNPEKRGRVEQERPHFPPFGDHSPENAKLAAAFLAPDCVGAQGLTEAEIATLNTIRDGAAPQASKP
jgi:hypothetical protein